MIATTRWAITVIRGADPSDPIAAHSVHLGMSGTQLSAASVTTVRQKSMLLGLYAIEAGYQTFSPPQGMTEAYDTKYGGASWGISAMAAYDLQGPIGPSGDKLSIASKSNDSAISRLLVINPQARPPKIQTLQGNCSNLTTLEVLFSEPMARSSVEDINHYQITGPDGRPLPIQLAEQVSDASVRLTLFTAMNDLTRYRLTVTAVISAAGVPIAPGSGGDILQSCGLNCVTDAFTTPGPLSNDWSVGHSNGNFGDPRIVNSGRLQLTDNNGDVATVATLLKQFPAANNRIEIEFDYYAYAGNGADGIALTLSDAAVPPRAGAFGGSLGYAQKTGIDGFSGGWLGIGIDEYGNYSAASEGRVGGRGFSRDAVAIRGSGKGRDGYPYLIGTQGLSPGIDQAGSRPNPGHRYKIVLDHTRGGNVALASVHRNSGSGYQPLIGEFNVFDNNAQQAEVPASWVMSFTGSTGGSTNIHEIGNLKVCAAQKIETFSKVDHYDIAHVSPALTCEASAVTITAHDERHNPVTVLQDTQLSIATEPAVSHLEPVMAVIAAGASQTISYLQQGTALANIDIDVSDGEHTDVDGGGEDPQMSFVDAALRFYAADPHTEGTPIGPQISAKPSFTAPGAQTLSLRAVRKNTDTGACEAALSGDTRIGWAYECRDPERCSSVDQLTLKGTESEVVFANPDSHALHYRDVTMRFDGAGRAPFSFNYQDAGKIRLHAQFSRPPSDRQPAVVLNGESNEFVVRPFGFHLGFSGHNAANSQAQNAQGSAYKKSGEAFTMTVQGVAWQGEDDQLDVAGNRVSDGIPDEGADLGDNSVVVNFGQETVVQPIVFSHNLRLPVAGESGQLSAQALSAGRPAGQFVAGQGRSQLSWSEVGIIDIEARLEEYLGSQDISARVNQVGRFYPAKFSLLSSQIGNSCGAFSYFDQQGIEIFYYLQAKNMTSKVTENYAGEFVRTSQRLVAENNNTGENHSTRLEKFTAGSWRKGEYVYADQGLFSRRSSPDGPYTGLDIGLIVEDLDGAELVDKNMNATTADDCGSSNSCDAARIGKLDVRWGELGLKNVFGPETQSLDMLAQVRYFDGQQMVLNNQDSCTTLSVNPTNFSPVLGSWSGRLSAGDSHASLGTAMTSGQGTIALSAPGLGHEGGVIYRYQVPSWLKSDSDNNGHYQDDPLGSVTFGQFRGTDRIIYWRELSP